MKRLRLFSGLISAMLMVVLLVGCDSTTEEQLVFTFGGDECTVSGSTELTVGEQPFLLKNQSGENLSLYVTELRDGHTHQDLIDRVSELGSKIASGGPNWPDFLGSHGTFAGYEKDEATGEELFTIRILKEGDYTSYLHDSNTGNLYPCAQLEVVKASPE